MNFDNSWEFAEEWLPDFIAAAERPDHPDAASLTARARANVHESYRQMYEGDEDVPDWMIYAEETVIFCLGVTRFIVENFDRKGTQ